WWSSTRRSPTGRASWLSVTTGSGSCGCCGPVIAGGPFLEHRTAIVLELGQRLPDVVHGPVSAHLLRSGTQHFGIPAAGQLLDGGNIDRAVVQVIVDGRQLGGQEALVGADRVSAQGD